MSERTNPPGQLADPDCGVCGGTGEIAYGPQREHCLCVRAQVQHLQQQAQEGALRRMIREEVLGAIGEALGRERGSQDAGEKE